MKSIQGTTITRGSGGVFTDFGFSPAESRNLRIRSEMMTALRKFIEKEGLTQAAAAKRLEVSLDALVNMLTDAGLEIDLRISPQRAVSPDTRVPVTIGPWSGGCDS